jgi:hypothetical protein
MEPVTQDDYVMKKSEKSLGESSTTKLHDTFVHPKVMLDKQLISIQDQNGSSDYSRNESRFNTLNIASSSRLPNYSEGYILVPVVCRLNRTPFDVTQDADNACAIINAHDQIQFKSGSCNIVDKMQIDFANSNVTQGTKNLNAYITFKKHVEYSGDNLRINGEKTGYYKPTNNWNYDTKKGMTFSGTNDYAVELEQVKNADVLTMNNIKTAGMNRYEKITNFEHIYYYYCMVALKDYSFFENLPLSKGSNLDIIMNFNQSLTTRVFVNGVCTNCQHQLTGSTNPLLRINEPSTIYQPPGGPPIAPGVGMNFTETISLSIGQIQGTHTMHTHDLKQCRLFLPDYVLSPSKFTEYLKSPVKKIIYDEIIVKHLVNIEPNSNIDAVISGNISNFKSLVIIPMLSKNSNITENLFTKYSPQETCFAQEPSVCSPYAISNFNVKVGTQNIYTSNMNFRHDNYLLELSGSQGLEGGIETGVGSGMLSMKDYMRNFGYIVVDLSRRGIDDVDKPLNVEITGKIDSPKSLDLMCYLVSQKQVIIDISTGGIVQQQ